MGGKSPINSACAQLMWDEDEEWKFLISQISIYNTVIYLVWKLYGSPKSVPGFSQLLCHH